MESKIRLIWDDKWVKIKITLSRRVAATLMGVALYLAAPDVLSHAVKLIEAVI